MRIAIAKALWTLSGLCAVLMFVALFSAGRLADSWMSTRPLATNDPSLSVRMPLHGQTYFISVADREQLHGLLFAALGCFVIGGAAWMGLRELERVASRPKAREKAT